MDESRIKALTEEVLAQIRPDGRSKAAGGDLESRVAALEAALRELRGAPSAAPRVVAAAVVVTAAGVHPSQTLLHVAGGGSGQCLLEPDKPCVGSGACRTFGH
jgi:hypothetical protein